LLRRHLHQYQVIPVQGWDRAILRTQQGDVRALIVAGPLPEDAPSLSTPVISCSFSQPATPAVLPEATVSIEKPLSLESVSRALSTIERSPERVLVVSEYAETGRVLTRMVSALCGPSTDIALALDLAAALEQYETMRPNVVFVDLDATQEEIDAHTIDLLLARRETDHAATIVAMTWGAEGEPLRGGPLTITCAERLSLSDYIRTIEAILDVTYPVTMPGSTSSGAPSTTAGHPA